MVEAAKRTESSTSRFQARSIQIISATSPISNAGGCYCASNYSNRFYSFCTRKCWLRPTPQWQRFRRVLLHECGPGLAQSHEPEWLEWFGGGQSFAIQRPRGRFQRTLWVGSTCRESHMYSGHRRALFSPERQHEHSQFFVWPAHFGFGGEGPAVRARFNWRCAHERKCIALV